jgi:hypothetical protein
MTTIRTRSIAGLAAATLLLSPALAGCGQAAETVAENAMENALSGADVNIEDDSVTITDDQGNQMAAGENIALPDNWPAEVPAFDGGTLSIVTVSPDGVYAAWTTDGSAQEVADAYGASLEDAGYTVGTQGNAAGSIFREYKGNGWIVTISSAESDSETMLMVTGAADESGSMDDSTTDDSMSSDDSS